MKTSFQLSLFCSAAISAVGLISLVPSVFSCDPLDLPQAKIFDAAQRIPADEQHNPSFNPKLSPSTSGVHPNVVALAPIDPSETNDGDLVLSPSGTHYHLPQNPRQRRRVENECNDTQSDEPHFSALAVSLSPFTDWMVWPDRTLVYRFHEDIEPSAKARFQEATQIISNRSVVLFREVTNEEVKSASDFALRLAEKAQEEGRPVGELSDDEYDEAMLLQRFITLRSDKACQTNMIGYPDVTMFATGTEFFASVQEGDCNTEMVGSFIHELLHGLGTAHAHSHPLRDEFVQVNLENVISDYYQSLEIIPEDQRDEFDLHRPMPYDFSSLMHYHGKSFIKPEVLEANPDAYTIRTLDPTYQDVIGQRRIMSEQDVMGLMDTYSGNATHRVFYKNECNAVLKLVFLYTSIDGKVRYAPDAGGFIWVQPGQSTSFLFATNEDTFHVHVRRLDEDGSEHVVTQRGTHCIDSYPSWSGRTCFVEARETDNFCSLQSVEHESSLSFPSTSPAESDVSDPVSDPSVDGVELDSAQPEIVPANPTPQSFAGTGDVQGRVPEQAAEQPASVPQTASSTEGVLGDEQPSNMFQSEIQPTTNAPFDVSEAHNGLEFVQTPDGNTDDGRREQEGNPVPLEQCDRRVIGFLNFCDKEIQVVFLRFLKDGSTQVFPETGLVTLSPGAQVVGLPPDDTVFVHIAGKSNTEHLNHAYCVNDFPALGHICFHETPLKDLQINCKNY